EPGASGTIFSTDDEGHPRPSLTIQGLAQPVDFWEEMAWIPTGAPAHGGTMAVLGFRNSEGVSHLFYIRLDGSVEQELVPQPGPPLETYFCGISYWPEHPTTLLLTDCSIRCLLVLPRQRIVRRQRRHHRVRHRGKPLVRQRVALAAVGECFDG